MKVGNERKSPVVVDLESHARYEYVAAVGKSLFGNTALVDASRPISAMELALIRSFHKVVSPANPNRPWDLLKKLPDFRYGYSEIHDPSTFTNWEEPGGPLEHIELAQQAASIIVRLLQTYANDPSRVDEKLAKDVIEQIRSIDPNHTAAAAGLHDEGREVTHLFYTNETIGRQLLRRIGIRDDILAILPDEDVMQVATTEIVEGEREIHEWKNQMKDFTEKHEETTDAEEVIKLQEQITTREETLREPRKSAMHTFIHGMSPEAVIVRLADEFGKRRGKSNQLWQLKDFDRETQRAWGAGYLNRPFSGRPSDRYGREILYRHNENAEAYFAGLDDWVR